MYNKLKASSVALFLGITMCCSVAYCDSIAEASLNWADIQNMSINWSDIQAITKYESEDDFVKKQQDSFGKDMTYRAGNNVVKAEYFTMKEYCNENPKSNICLDADV